MLPALYTLSSLRFWLARNARAYTSARSIGFCVIWVCISSSSSSLSTSFALSNKEGSKRWTCQIISFHEWLLRCCALRCRCTLKCEDRESLQVWTTVLLDYSTLQHSTPFETGPEGPELEDEQVEKKSKAAQTRPKKLIRRTCPSNTFYRVFKKAFENKRSSQFWSSKPFSAFYLSFGASLLDTTDRLVQTGCDAWIFLKWEKFAMLALLLALVCCLQIVMVRSEVSTFELPSSMLGTWAGIPDDTPLGPFQAEDEYRVGISQADNGDFLIDNNLLWVTKFISLCLLILWV